MRASRVTGVQQVMRPRITWTWYRLAVTRDRARPPAKTPLHVAADVDDRTLPGAGDVVEIPRIELVVEREGEQAGGRVVVFDGDLCRIGSHPSNELVLDDRKVSRFHCRLRRERSGWRVVDDGSLNGTAINGLRVRDADLALPECRIAVGGSVVRVNERRSVSQTALPSWPRFGALVGSSIAMRQLFGVLDRVARSDATVLVEGESGTGKELIATEVVQRGPRAKKPFVIVDCGAIAPELIESELFGHVRGSFTGADRDRVGAFEAAEGGTVFLDEIGEMPLAMQPKLLRALEAREIRRVGENRARKVDVRVIAATNRRLEREVNQGRFREDLYFRLSVVTIRVPPLREHVEDLPLLVDVILAGLNAETRRGLFDAQVIAEMARYDWPGNVRELRNFVERSVVLEKVDHAPASQHAPAMGAAGVSADAAAGVNIDIPFKTAKDDLVADFESRYVQALLVWSGGKVGPAARKAGVDRMHLYRIMQRHGIRRGPLSD